MKTLIISLFATLCIISTPAFANPEGYELDTMRLAELLDLNDPRLNDPLFGADLSSYASICRAGTVLWYQDRSLELPCFVCLSKESEAITINCLNRPISAEEESLEELAVHGLCCDSEAKRVIRRGQELRLERRLIGKPCYQILGRGKRACRRLDARVRARQE